MDMRKSWMLALLLIAALAFAGCGTPAAPAAPADDAAADSAEAAAEEGGEMAEETAMDWESVDPSGQTVVFWHQHTRDRESALNEIVEEFNNTNEYGITVTAEYQGGYGDIFNKMLNVLNSPEAPSLVVAYQNQAATYQLADSLVDMTGLVESEQWGETEEELSDFFPGFISADVFPSFGNQRLGFPPNRSMEVMYYNQDWLNELGYDAPPATPEEFREIACAAVENPFSGAVGDAPSMGYQLSVNASRLASWSFAFGGEVFDYDAGEFDFNNEGAAAAMQFLQDLFNEGCATIVAEQYGDQTDFGNGNLLFTVGSSSGLPFYDGAVSEGADFTWSVAPLPRTTDEPVMNVYGASVSIPKTTPEQELAAWLFLKHYTSPEVQAKWAQASNYFPVRQSVAEGLSDYFSENPAYQTAFDLLQYGVAEPPVPGYDFVRDEADVVLAAIVDGAPVQESLDDLTATANEILAEQMADMQ